MVLELSSVATSTPGTSGAMCTNRAVTWPAGGVVTWSVKITALIGQVELPTLPPTNTL